MKELDGKLEIVLEQQREEEVGGEEEGEYILK
jgi:hypothetical protein